MEELKRVFPERTQRSGVLADWKFGNFHARVHVFLIIPSLDSLRIRLVRGESISYSPADSLIRLANQAKDTA